MKKLLKISLFILFFLLVLGITNSVNANSISKISMDIYVDDNGNAQVTEVWDCSANKGTEVYHPYFNLGNSKITNLTVSDKGRTYESLSSWNTSGSLSSKAYKCGINKTSNGVELCWGISEYGKHNYTVRYNISNFVSNLTDSQMIYWTLIPYEFSESIGTAYIKIHTNSRISDDTPVWGYGNYGGTCYVYDGYIEMQSDGRLAKDEYMTILVKFEPETFNTTNNLNHDFDYYFKMSQEGAKKYEESFWERIEPFLHLIVYAIPIILTVVISLILGNKNKFNFGPEGKKFTKETPYFRDIPCNNNLFRAYYIAYEYGIITKKTDLLGAIILKWIKEGIVRVEKAEVGKLFKKEDTAIVFDTENVSKLSDDYERRMYDMMYKASGDGILESKEFEKWCRNHYSKVLDWFDDIIEDEKDKLVAEGIITLEEKKSLGIFTSKVYTATPALRQEAEQIYGLKHYLLDYTLIPDREAVEVQLFEEYLIYAQMMGIADKVAKEFKKLYPDVIEQSNFNTYDTIIYVHMCSSRATVAATTARSRAQSYSSGGGGFSSGGGGGGSFGGGGGGGGFR